MMIRNAIVMKFSPLNDFLTGAIGDWQLDSATVRN